MEARRKEGEKWQDPEEKQRQVTLSRQLIYFARGNAITIRAGGFDFGGR
jgi:hypothetical protein